MKMKFEGKMDSKYKIFASANYFKMDKIKFSTFITVT